MSVSGWCIGINIAYDLLIDGPFLEVVALIRRHFGAEEALTRRFKLNGLKGPKDLAGEGDHNTLA